MLTILFFFRIIYFLTNFLIFCKFPGLNANRLEFKQRAQRGMTFLIRTYIFVLAAKKRNIYGEKKGSNLCQKYEIQIFVKNVTFSFGFSKKGIQIFVMIFFFEKWLQLKISRLKPRGSDLST